MTQLFLEGSQYRVPDEWRNPDWISNFDNFPDPFFRHLHKEYDWIEKSSKGLLYGYIKQLAGKEYANNVYEDVPAQEGRVAKGNKAHPETYFLFAVGATKIINKPSLLRLPYYKKLTGGHVVNYVNTVPIEDLFPKNYQDHEIFGKLQSRKTILPVKYSALFARTFNAFSGILNDDYLKVKDREEHLVRCPACKAIFDRTGPSIYTPDDIKEYNLAYNRLIRQQGERWASDER